MTIMAMRFEFFLRRRLLRPVWLLGVIAVLIMPLPARADGPNHDAAASGSARGIPANPHGDQGGVVVDGVAAVVNQEAITQSEVEDAAWFARFSSRQRDTGKATPLDSGEYQQALQHLIDQDLLLQEQEKAGYGPAAPEEVQNQIDEMARRMGGKKEWEERLHDFHLQMTALKELIRRQLTILHFLDEKLRPSIVIDEQQIEAYYRKDFIPQAEIHRLQPAPLDNVREEIRRILMEQEMGRVQQQWLQQLRASAVIETRGAHFSPAG